MNLVPKSQINGGWYIPQSADVSITSETPHTVLFEYNPHLEDPMGMTISSGDGATDSIANVTNYSCHENSLWRDISRGPFKYQRIISIADFLDQVGIFLLAAKSDALVYHLQKDVAARYGAYNAKLSYATTSKKEYPLKENRALPFPQRIETAKENLSDKISRILEDKSLTIDLNSQVRVETRQSHRGPIYLTAALDIAYNHERLCRNGVWFRYQLRIEARGRR